MLNYLTVLVYTKTIIHLSVGVGKYPLLATSTSVNNCYIPIYSYAISIISSGWKGMIQKYFVNPKKYFKSQYFSKTTVENFEKYIKLLPILIK